MTKVYARFPALGTGRTFSRAWHRLHIFPCLAPGARFSFYSDWFIALFARRTQHMLEPSNLFIYFNHTSIFLLFHFRALFIMLDSLQNEEPEIRLVSEVWIALAEWYMDKNMP